MGLFVNYYNVTPCLNIARSWKPASSALTFLPEATARTKSNNSFDTSSILASSTRRPQLKSIQLPFLPASFELVEILTVGTGDAKGVPRPVVNSTICAPEAASAVEATRSFHGALKRLRPFVSTFSP